MAARSILDTDPPLLFGCAFGFKIFGWFMTLSSSLFAGGLSHKAMPLSLHDSKSPPFPTSILG